MTWTVACRRAESLSVDLTTAPNTDSYVWTAKSFADKRE